METVATQLENFFINLENPILQAFVAGLFTWVLTALGASLVFFFKSAVCLLCRQGRTRLLKY